MSKVDVKIEEGHLVVGADLNEDGEPVLSARVNLSEGLEEAFKKEAAVEGVKVAEAKFTGTKLSLVLDTDRDGEKLAEITLDLAEAFDEATGVFKK